MSIDSNIQGYLLVDRNTTAKEIDEMLLDPNQHSGVLNISFGNFDSEGRFLPPDVSRSVMEEIVKDAQARGISLKISLGGAAGAVILPDPSINRAYYENAGSSLAAFMQQYGFSGVDLDIENFNTTASQVALIESFRDHLGSAAQITYTVEGTLPLSMNYQQVIQACKGILTAVNLMAYDTFWSGYDFKEDIATLQSWGLENSQIILGVFPEAGGKEGGNTLEQIREMAKFAKTEGLQVSFWDINNDFYGETNLPKNAGELEIWNILHSKN